MSSANVWLAASEDMMQAYKDYPNSSMDEQSYDIISSAWGIEGSAKLFKAQPIGGKDWSIFGLYTPRNPNLQNIKSSLDYLEATWPNDCAVAGAWYCIMAGPDGKARQAGIAEDGTGTPIWPINFTQLIKFMPDVDGQPATELTDVSLVSGQLPRNFEVA